MQLFSPAVRVSHAALYHVLSRSYIHIFFKHISYKTTAIRYICCMRAHFVFCCDQTNCSMPRVRPTCVCVCIHTEYLMWHLSFMCSLFFCSFHILLPGSPQSLDCRAGDRVYTSCCCCPYACSVLCGNIVPMPFHGLLFVGIVCGSSTTTWLNETTPYTRHGSM